MVAAKEAVSSLRNNTNTSNTALQQAMVAGTVTQGNLTAAMAQLMVRRPRGEYEQEIARREELARFVEAERQAAFDAQQAGIVDSMPRGCFSESRRSTDACRFRLTRISPLKGFPILHSTALTALHRQAGR